MQQCLLDRLHRVDPKVHEWSQFRCAVCLSVDSVPMSVTFVDHVKTNRGLNVSSKFFQPSGSHAILVFPYQIGRRYSDGNPLTEASNAGGYRHKSRFWCNSWLSKIAGRANCQNIYRGRSCVYDTVGHAPLAIDQLLDVRTTK